MAITVSTVRTAIETRLATISGMHTNDRMPENVEPPMAVCYPVTPITFDETHGRGVDLYTFAVVVFVARADSETAQGTLDGYLNASGSTSIKAALEGGTPARTLGGSVATCHVTHVSEIGVVEVADVPYLFAEFTLQVHG